MTRRPEVDDLHAKGKTDWVNEHDVLRLEVGVDEAEVLEFEQCREHLLRDGTDRLERQWLELVLLEEVVQILLEHLEHETCVVLVLEALVGANKVELVGILLAEPRQDRHLDLALARVRWVILENLDRYDLIRALLPALDHLPKGASPEELEHLVGGRNRVQDLMLHELVVALSAQ